MNAHHYGVVVGINRYPGFRPLKHARKDAEDFYKWLIDPEGGDVPEENAALITVPDEDVPDGTPLEQARPVRRQVEDALDKFRRRCKAHIENEPADWYATRLYFFASGHGIATGYDDAAVLMADASRDYYGRNFSCSRYLESFRKEQQFRELVFFADCCRERVSNVPINGPDWTIVPTQPRELVIIRGYATYFGELAFEQKEDINDPDQLRGYFTKALLEGLRRETQEIDSITLGDFVTERVKAMTSHLPMQQKPFFLPEPSSPRIVFKRGVPPEHAVQPITYEVRIFFPAGFSGWVKLNFGDRQRVENYEVGDNPWIVHLADSTYQVTLEDGSNPFQVQGFSVFGGKQDVHL